MRLGSARGSSKSSYDAKQPGPAGIGLSSDEMEGWKAWEERGKAGRRVDKRADEHLSALIEIG